MAGSVTIDGKPAVNAQLKLDGANRGNTDAGGRFLLTEVGKGQHRLHLELAGAKPRDKVFTVASGQTALQVGNVEMEPLVRLGYTASLQMPLLTQQLNYDITLWIIGDSDVLSRIQSVSYTLPIPLSTRPVSGASASHAFCYRQTGSLSLQQVPLGNSAFALASAVVDLGGGEKFHISAASGKTQPPACPAHRTGVAVHPSTAPAPSPSPRQSGSSPTSTASQTKVQSVIGLTAAEAQRILNGQGFQVAISFVPAPGMTPGTVVSQDPAPDTASPPGTTVQIFVSAQALPSPSPSTTPA